MHTPHLPSTLSTSLTLVTALRHLRRRRLASTIAYMAALLALPGVYAQAPPPAAALAAASAATLPPGHPLLGVWQGAVAVPLASRDASGKALPATCRETLDYRANHIRLGTSGKEITRGTFSVALAPSPLGFYELTETLLASNGSADCAGDVHAAADEPVVRFVQFSPQRDQFIVCKEAALTACFGPFKRQP